MAPHLAFLPPTDTLTFSLTEEMAVTSDTVRIVVTVHAQKTPGMTEGASLPPDDNPISNATRVSMTAAVTLRWAPPQ